MDRPTEYSATILLKALLLPGFYEALRGVNPDDFGDYYALRDQLEEQQFDFIGQAAPGIEAALNRYLDRQLAAPMVPAVRGEDYDPRALAAIFLDPSTPERELESASLYGYRAGDDAEPDIIGDARNLLAEYCRLLGDGDRADALALLAILVGDFDAWRQALAGEDLDTLQRDLKAQAEGVRIRHIVTVRMPEGRWNDWSKTATLDVETYRLVAEGETVAEAIRSCQLGTPLLEFESPEPWSGPAPRRQVVAEPEPESTPETLFDRPRPKQPRGDRNPEGFLRQSVSDFHLPSVAARLIVSQNEGIANLLSNRKNSLTKDEWDANVRAIRSTEAKLREWVYDLTPKGVPLFADRRKWWRWWDATLAATQRNEPTSPYRGTYFFDTATPQEMDRATRRYGFGVKQDPEEARNAARRYGALLKTEPEPELEPPVREVAPGVTAYEFSRMQDDDEKRQAAASLVSQLSPRRAPVAESDAVLRYTLAEQGIDGFLVPRSLLPQLTSNNVPTTRYEYVFGNRMRGMGWGVYQRSTKNRDAGETNAWNDDSSAGHLDWNGVERVRRWGEGQLNAQRDADAEAAVARPWIVSVFGEGVLEPLNITRLSNYLEGRDEAPQFVITNKWLDGLQALGVIDAAGKVDPAKIRAAYRAAAGRTGNPRRRPNPDIGTSMVYGYGINQMTPSAPMGASSAVRSARLAAEAERLAQRLARGRR